MKVNINNRTFTCKEQYTVCDNCLFRGNSTCTNRYPILNKLCIDFDIIFVKRTSSDIFDL